ncbi:hypothetical protein [Mucilaginibacter gotjawali]|uniref:YcxB-like protein domain-containing protein n=1 Tax=Mucilaginibacter gotjawali TaxID=1550579 RepID=A0A839SBF7_9SPHI|nr:hypothetical protein [Mucilaginibacter gotjawali]MBB3054672.1 hypothetical protein [Mucilaginibacter gotjawali]
MTQTFSINQDLIGSLQQRIAIRFIKIYAVVLILIILPDIINPTKPIMSIGVAICGVIFMIGFTIIIGVRKARKTYRSFQIALDDVGIELKAPMTPYKRIDWSEVDYDEKKNGDIKVYNKTVGAFSRWWAGNGVIFIPREINDRDQLILSIDRHLKRI